MSWFYRQVQVHRAGPQPEQKQRATKGCRHRQLASYGAPAGQLGLRAKRDDGEVDGESEGQHAGRQSSPRPKHGPED